MKTKSSSRLNVEEDCALSCIEPRIPLHSNNKPAQPSIIVAHAVLLNIVFLFAYATVIALEKLHSRWAMDLPFVY